MNNKLAEEFRSRAIHHLMVDFLPKIGRCLESLTEEEIWWRPNQRSNSVGNMILHLSGNIRQWVISALGGDPDLRQRDEEFAARGPMPVGQLLDLLERTLAEATKVLASLGPEELLRQHRIQVYEVSALQAVFHVVEHFSYHTGQIIYVTKLIKDQDLEFYAELNEG